MLPQEFIERLDAAPIAQVIERFGQVELKAGKCCCPIHKERTPSLSVSPGKNAWHCFGCGRGGGPVQFLMAMGHTWIEAMKALAEMQGEPWPSDYQPDPAQQAREQARNAMLGATVALAEICREALCNPESPQAQEAMGYCINRFGDPRTEGTPAHTFGLGYMPHDVAAKLAHRNVRPEDAQAAGLFTPENIRYGGPLAGRLIIPIHDATGRAVGFSGRKIAQDSGNAKSPKYINTRASDIFTKGALLFGYHSARQAAQASGRFVLVEGYADVMRLRSLGVEEAVGTMGTALSDAQIKAIARMARSVLIVPDGDEAGRNACLGWGWRLAAAGIFVSVATLPTLPDGSKADADSALQTREDFDALQAEDFPVYAARSKWLTLSAADAQQRTMFAQQMLNALTNYDPEYRALAARDLDALDGGSYWREALQRRARIASSTPVEPSSESNAKRSTTLAQYRFEVRGGSLWSPDKEGKTLRPVANFVVEPLYYIREPENGQHRRLIRVTNTRGEVRTVVLDSSDDAMYSAARFRACMAREGNYSYTASEWAFLGLFQFINDGCLPCQAIPRLGWQPDAQMFAWANGVYAEGAWYPLGEEGTCTVRGQHYWLDAAARAGRLAASMRYRADAASIDLPAWIARMHGVFGGYGSLAALYIIATLCRDVVRRVGPLPLLNACGPRGTGKSAIALSVVGLFFERPTLLNLPTSTLASLSAVLGSFSHVPIGLDEYSNAVGPTKVELLKSSYDGGGRQKMVGPSQVDSAEVHSGIMLCGQQLAESDPALFSRLLYMQFSRARYTQQETEALVQLRQLESQGLGHIVHAMLDLRGEVSDGFAESYRTARARVEEMLQAAGIAHSISRTVHAWSVLLGIYYALRNRLAFPQSEDEMLQLFADTLREQSREMDDGDEVRGFWATFVYLVNRGEIRPEVDYRIEERRDVTGPAGTRIVFPEGPRRVIHLVIPTVIPLYERHGANVVGESLLSPSTMRAYLRKSEAFISLHHRVSLGVSDGRGGMQYSPTPGDASRPMRQSKCVYTFTYDALGIDVESEQSQDVQDDPAAHPDAQTESRPVEPSPFGNEPSSGLPF